MKLFICFRKRTNDYCALSLTFGLVSDILMLEMGDITKKLFVGTGLGIRGKASIGLGLDTIGLFLAAVKQLLTLRGGGYVLYCTLLARKVMT